MKQKRFFLRLFGGFALAALLFFLATLVLKGSSLTGPALTLFFAFLALYFHFSDRLKKFAYTIWIFAAVTVSMNYPEVFSQVGDFDLKKLIVPLLQIIMFGMGSQLSLKNFKDVILMPRGVIIGIICQFSIMPLVGFSIAKLFGFPPEIAAGIILVGSSPSGLASNVMSFIARANLALSVTLTAVATLLAPLVTPALMKVLAGRFVPVDFWEMMLSITRIVIIPIVIGLAFNELLLKRFAQERRAIMDRLLALLSMVGIAVIITIITAAGRDSLLTIGLALILACLLHNMTGYGLGYTFCKLIRMDEQSCRTIALEVGMQNGGLASGIALEMGKVATVGLAPAVFGPMMNITGSSLATWWRGRGK